jgi:hypothetical protein
MLRAFRTLGAGLVVSVVWMTACGGSGSTGSGSNPQEPCAALSGTYEDDGGSCGAEFDCQIDRATCEATCVDGTELTVTPSADGFSYTSDDGKCTAEVNGANFSVSCTKGFDVCANSGEFTKSSGSGGSSSGGSSSGGGDTGGSSSGGSGGDGTGGTGPGTGGSGSGGLPGTGGTGPGTGGNGTGGNGEPTYVCTDGSSIPLERVCDGTVHCEDDELDCGNDCGSDECYVCFGGSLINAAFVCDGDFDCPEKDDEADCETEEGYTCDGTTTVIAEEYLCDGIYHCPDEDDEADCETEEGYTCDGTTTVIPEEDLCDGTSDCELYYDDEVGCPGTYVCEDGWVITEDQLCDGGLDCDSGEDEVCL